MITQAYPTSVTRSRDTTINRVLAAVGLAFLAYGLLTVLPWLLDGPQAVTAFRDRNDPSWIAARIYEGASLTVALVVGTIVVRGCIRSRRLTFDAKFCIAWAAMYWIDPTLNYFQPIWMYSSNWVNVANWCGHAPFVRNPDCGALPEPWLFMWPLYTVGFYSFVRIGCAVLNAARDRLPNLGKGGLWLIVLAWGLVIEIALELPMYNLHLWGYPGTPALLELVSKTNRYPAVQLVYGTLIFGLSTALYYFKDDHGRVLTERGLDGYRPPVRTAVSLLATYGIIGLIGLFSAIVPPVVLGFFSDPYPRMPAHLLNGMCDLPGAPHTTRYGPCPGGDGSGTWTVPIKP